MMRKNWLEGEHAEDEEGEENDEDTEEWVEEK